MNRLVYLKDVTTLRLNEELCNGCGMCLKVCPHAVFALSSKKAKIVDRDLCMECGACALNCAEGAIFVKAGVGCAAAVISGALSGKPASCGCSGSRASCN